MVTYELFYTPEMSKMQKESKLSDIDDRIAKIEKLIGSSSGHTVEDLVSSKNIYKYIYFIKLL